MLAARGDDATSAVRHRGGQMTLLHAQTLFREAVHDLAGEPSTVNVERYLAASQILDRAAANSEDPRAEALALKGS
jgi:hypothetical protein